MTLKQTHGRMIRALLLATLAFSFLPFAAAQEAPIDVAALELVERSTLDLRAGPARTSALLAPDGEHFVWAGPGDGERVICLYTIAGVRRGCAPVPRDIDNASLRWAPDSSGVIFAQDALRMFIDSDIWLFDVAALNVRNLTDDGEERLDVFSEEVNDVPVDIMPVWSADSQRVYFLRYSFVEEKRARPELYAYDLTSDALELLHTFTLSDPVSVYVMTVSAQGELAYVIDQRGDAPELHLFNLETKEDRLLRLVPPPQRGRSMITYLEFSPDGRYLMAHDAGPLVLMRFEAEAPAARLFDMNGVEIQIDEDNFVGAAGWLSEGAALVYLTWDGDDFEQGGVFLLAEPDQPARQVLDGRYGGTTSNQESLYWGANQTLLLTGRGGQPLHVLRFAIPE